MPLFASRKRQKQSSPFLRFFPEFYFCYGAFLRKVLGSELRELYWMCFRWFRVCVFVWFYLSDSGSSCFLPFSGLWGRCFGVRSLSPPPSSSPFLSWGRPGVSFSLFCVPVARTISHRRGRSGLALAFLLVVSSFFSLSPGRLPSPLLFLSFFLSLLFVLSLSLSCMHSVHLVDPASVIRESQRLSHACLSVSVSQQGCIWSINTAIIFAVLHHTWIPVEILGPIQVTYLTFGD